MWCLGDGVYDPLVSECGEFLAKCVEIVVGEWVDRDGG